MNGSDSFQLLFNEISRMINTINDTLALIGLFYVVKTSFKIINHLYKGVKVYVVAQVLSNDKWIHKMGEWAIIIDASHGLGLAYAKELARRKFNLILISSNKDQLDKIRTHFELNYGIQVLIIDADLSDEKSCRLVENYVNLYNIGILVNNAKEQIETDELHLMPENEKVDEIMDSNSKVVLHMTKLVMPQMLKKNKGCIVNVTSSAEYLPRSHISTFIASKVFIENFFESLEKEYRATNIIFQRVCPAYVRIGELEVLPREWMRINRINANTYAKSAVRTIGYTNHTCGYWLHGLAFTLADVFPKLLYDSILIRLYKCLFYKFERITSLKQKPSTFSHDDIDIILNSY